MTATVRASTIGLQQVDIARKKKNWAKTEPAWYDMVPTSQATLKRFWRGGAIQQEAFVAICQAVGIEDWQTIAALDSPTALPDRPALPFAFDDSNWVERSELMNTLIPVLRCCRVLALVGMTGIGKTALAERLVVELQDEKPFRRLNLDEGGITADFASSGAALLRSLGEEPTLDDQKDAKNLLTHILNLLRSQPCRIQIDSMEKLLAGDDRQGWSEFCDPLWLDLWQRVLAGDVCQSQIILTTQELPEALQAIGSRYPQLWQCQAIDGLSATEQLALFRKRGLPDDPESTGYLTRIGSLYAGHPLVLRVIAEDLMQECRGQVGRYWRLCGFEEMETNRPDCFSRRRLQVEVQKRVQQAIDRLPPDAKQLLCRSAVYRRPVPESFWMALLPEQPTQAALDLLKSQGLAVEEWEEGAWLGDDNAIPLRQHNLIRGAAYALLKADTATWQAAERKAAEVWLNHYEAVPEAANLEKARGYLEAFDHYCDVEDWKKAKDILINQRIGEQLETWSYYREIFALHSKLLGHLGHSVDVICTASMGTAYCFLGSYVQAFEYYEKSLTIARGSDDRQREIDALGGLGNVYFNQGNYAQATSLYEQCLAIACAIGDRCREGSYLQGLGNSYYRQGEYAQAIDYYQKSLAIAREIDDSQMQGSILGNLGSAYYCQSNYIQAVEHYQQHLAITRKAGNQYEESIALGNLGNYYWSQGEYDRAIEHHQKRLFIADKIGDCRGKGSALGNLGTVYCLQGNYAQAIEHHEQHLAISNKISDHQGEGIALANLGGAHCARGSYQEAISYSKQSLAITREISDQLGEGIAQQILGEAQIGLEQYTDALKASNAALEIFRKINNRSNEAGVLKNLAELHQKTGSIDLAHQYCDRALQLAIELGIPLVQECQELKDELENAE